MEEIMRCEKEMAYIELVCITMADHIAVMAELVKEEEPAKAILLDEAREAEEGERSDNRERELHHHIIGAAMTGITSGASKDKMGKERDSDS